ncbi:hypothetical protein ACRRTK_024316 [Alexandromys fortis]
MSWSGSQILSRATSTKWSSDGAASNTLTFVLRSCEEAQGKNWSTSWIVLSGPKIEFYKDAKQQALPNMSNYGIPCIQLTFVNALMTAPNHPNAIAVSCGYCKVRFAKLLHGT